MTPIQFGEEYTDQPDAIRENADDCFVVGTPGECAAAIEERLDLGVTKFRGWFVNLPDTGGTELSADDVMSEFRERLSADSSQLLPRNKLFA